MASRHFDPDAHLARAYVPRDENLAPLVERATQLIELRKLFRESVPDGLNSVCEVANLRRNAGYDTVVILAANSASAAKLKQLCPRLISLFQKRGWQVNSIKITVQGA
jgi:hypothetical protein